MAIPPPNYTQIPNAVLDAMPQMKESELRVTLAVCRMTFGWHKEKDKLSISQIEELSGLSRQGTINGVQAGMERGVIVREPDGAGFLYSINVEPLIQVEQVEPAQPVNLVDTLPVNQVDTLPAEPPASQRSRPEVVNYVDQPLVNVVDQQKKEDKEKKENITYARADAATVTAAVTARLEQVGVCLNPYTITHYTELVAECGLPAVLAGLTAAADNGKQHRFKYVAQCARNKAQGIDPVPPERITNGNTYPASGGRRAPAHPPGGGRSRVAAYDPALEAEYN